VIVVDIQHDFTELKNGALAVKGTDSSYIQDVINTTWQLKNSGCFVVATQDYHSQKHSSFASTYNRKPFETIVIQNKEQVLWPDHCVQGTEGSQLLIPLDCLDYVQSKGTTIDIDSYSGFFEGNQVSTGLHEMLSTKGIDTVIIYGIAIDYCVKATAIDAVKLGYTVYVIEGLSRGVSLNTITTAKQELHQSGVILVSSLEELEQ
jgi:nicotinamidase/pyrazinamidase